MGGVVVVGGGVVVVGGGVVGGTVVLITGGGFGIGTVVVGGAVVGSVVAVVVGALVICVSCVFVDAGVLAARGQRNTAATRMSQGFRNFMGVGILARPGGLTASRPPRSTFLVDRSRRRSRLAQSVEEELSRECRGLRRGKHTPAASPQPATGQIPVEL